MANTGHFDISCNGQLSVELHQPGLMGLFKGTIPADCHQISRNGMQIETTRELKVGQRVVVDVQVHDLRVEELHGIVSSTTAVGNRYYYDVDFKRTRQSRDAVHCLRQLESHIRESEFT